MHLELGSGFNLLSFHPNFQQISTAEPAVGIGKDYKNAEYRDAVFDKWDKISKRYEKDRLCKFLIHIVINTFSIIVLFIGKEEQREEQKCWKSIVQLEIYILLFIVLPYIKDCLSYIL